MSLGVFFCTDMMERAGESSFFMLTIRACREDLSSSLIFFLGKGNIFRSHFSTGAR